MPSVQAVAGIRKRVLVSIQITRTAEAENSRAEDMTGEQQTEDGDHHGMTQSRRQMEMGGSLLS